MIPLS